MPQVGQNVQYIRQTKSGTQNVRPGLVSEVSGALVEVTYFSSTPGVSKQGNLVYLAAGATQPTGEAEWAQALA
jgi:hypothetical protein